MTRIRNLNTPAAAATRTATRNRVMESAPVVGDTSVNRGALRIASNEGLLVEGSAKVEGWLVVTGTERITGLLEVLGSLVASGAITLTGPTSINGTTSISGATTLHSTLNVAGQIVAGDMTIDTAGGGRITAPTIHLDGPVLVSGVMTVSGSTLIGGNLVVTGTKAFVMDHPIEEGRYLFHAATESDVSGVEYWGEGTLDSSGECVVSLPTYFEALTKGSAPPIVSAIGRPFMVSADRVSGHTFTVFGDAGREFSWLVKAERVGADFEPESDDQFMA